MKSNLNCSDVRASLSHSVDSLGEPQAAALRQHLQACPECDARVEQLTAMRRMLRDHGRVKPPADLELQIRLRVSHQSTQMSLWTRLCVHLENFLRPIAIPAISGLVTTLLIFGGFLYQFYLPLNIANDVPLLVRTPPRLHAIPQVTFATSPDGVFVLADVDYQGRITNIQVLDGEGNPEQMRELRYALLFTRWEPATRFGVPTSGRAVINLRQRISVKG